MDNLRGTWGDHADACEGAAFPGLARDPDDDLDLDLAGDSDSDVDCEPPPNLASQDERRMQVRAYNLWAGLLEDRDFPSVADLDIAGLPDFGPHAVLLDFTRGIDNPRISFLGAKLAEECGARGPIRRLSDVPGRSLLSRITDHYMQILANAAPIGFEAEFVNQRDCTILYRGILLPFSDDGAQISQILGVINWKELVDQQTTDALLLEIDQALRTAPAPGRAPRGAPAIPGGMIPPAPGSMAIAADGPDFPRAPAVPTIDSTGHGEPRAPGRIAWPQPTFGEIANTQATESLAPIVTAIEHSFLEHSFVASAAQSGALADCLAAARELALLARAGEERSRRALYAAIGRAHDVALAAAAAPAEFAELLADAGLVAQERAPLTAVVKLVFGADYDKTRVTEYAAALAYAARAGLGVATLGDHLTATPGGLKAVVTVERAARRGELPSAPTPDGPRPGLARKLRRLPPVTLESLAQGAEFTLLVARRGAAGEIMVLGEVAGAPALFDRAARALIG